MSAALFLAEVTPDKQLIKKMVHKDDWESAMIVAKYTFFPIFLVTTIFGVDKIFLRFLRVKTCISHLQKRNLLEFIILNNI